MVNKKSNVDEFKYLCRPFSNSIAHLYCKTVKIEFMQK